MPQPPGALSVRGLRLYFPELEPWVARSSSLPAVCPVYLWANVGLRCATRRSACLFSATLSPALSVYLCTNVGPQGLLVVRLPAPFVPHSASQSQSRQGHLSPLLPWLPVSTPPTGLDVCFFLYLLFLSTWTSLPFDFLSVLVVRGGTVCLLTPPSWFSPACTVFHHLPIASVIVGH